MAKKIRKMQKKKGSSDDRPGLVIGLVSPVGTDQERFCKIITDNLQNIYRYECTEIRLSSIIKELTPKASIKETPYVARAETYMNAGTDIRKKAQNGDALALHAAAEILDLHGNNGLLNRAIIIRSLKHPGEVQAFRHIYGDGFYLIGVFASLDERKRFLMEQHNLSENEALSVIERDEGEEEPLGQQVRKTFHLSDFFIEMKSSESETKNEIDRVLKLVFGHPYITPTIDEHAMFMAHASSIRSADLSRQVGAVILSESGDVIASGVNDVPCAGGGLYWPGNDDMRDFVRREDSNQIRRETIIDEVISVVSKYVSPLMEDQKRDLRNNLKGSLIGDITEYGRAVHAEMEALLACARIGASPLKSTLYATTFPCHNCAKHIVASGVRRVVYIEPYPKSLAKKLHGDAIEFYTGKKGEQRLFEKVAFEPFVGVGPRRYIDLFSMSLGSGRKTERKDSNGKTLDWQPQKALPRIPMHEASYIDREKHAAYVIESRQKGSTQ